MIQLQLSALPFQTGNAQAWDVCLWFFKATWLWGFIHLLALLLFQSDDHGAVAENIDSTWEAQLRLGQVSNRYTDWNPDVCKSKKLSLSTAKPRFHIQKFKPAMLRKTAEEKGWISSRCDWRLHQLPFWNLIRKTKFPNTLCQGVPRSHLEARDWNWGNGRKYL